jgi:hypothetical protein
MVTRTHRRHCVSIEEMLERAEGCLVGYNGSGEEVARRTFRKEVSRRMGPRQALWQTAARRRLLTVVDKVEFHPIAAAN